MTEITFLPFERVLIHTYDGEKWTKTAGEIALEPRPFAQGAFRKAYRARLIKTGSNDVDGSKLYVCKFAMDAETPKQLYLHDVEAQVYASKWAEQFNLRNPPIPVYFVEAFVVEFVERAGRPYAGCELYIKGEFQKHNNNVGAVSTEGGQQQAGQVQGQAQGGAQSGSSNVLDLLRDVDEVAGGSSSPSITGMGAAAAATMASGTEDGPSLQDVIDTANAFSHFTYYASQKQILICDIQGVGGIYTDPQVHTLQSGVFGVGNLGYTGIRAFLLRHVCTRMCAAINLPKIPPKDLAERPEELLTLPMPSSATKMFGSSSTPTVSIAFGGSVLPNSFGVDLSNPTGANGATFKGARNSGSSGTPTITTGPGGAYPDASRRGSVARLANLVDSILNDDDDDETRDEDEAKRRARQAEMRQGSFSTAPPPPAAQRETSSADDLLSQLELLDLVQPSKSTSPTNPKSGSGPFAPAAQTSSTGVPTTKSGSNLVMTSTSPTPFSQSGAKAPASTKADDNLDVASWDDDLDDLIKPKNSATNAPQSSATSSGDHGGGTATLVSSANPITLTAAPRAMFNTGSVGLSLNSGPLSSSSPTTATTNLKSTPAMTTTKPVSGSSKPAQSCYGSNLDAADEDLMEAILNGL